MLCDLEPGFSGGPRLLGDDMSGMVSAVHDMPHGDHRGLIFMRVKLGAELNQTDRVAEVGV